MNRISDKVTTGKERFPYGYVILIVSFITLMILNGAGYSFAVFLKPVLTEFGWTRATTAAAYSLYYVCWGFWAILAGKLSDRFSPRLIVTVSGTLVSVCYFLMSQISTVWQFYLVYGVLLSLGMAAIYITLSSTVIRWFITKMGLASGILNAGIGAGVIIMPPLTSFLIITYDWRISFTAVAVLALIVPVVAQFIKREPGRPASLISDTDGAYDQPKLVRQGFSLGQAIRTRQFWLIITILIMMCISIQAVMAHIVAYATDAGISAAVAAAVLSVIGVVSTLSKVGIGTAIDRFRCKAVLIVITILMLASFLLLLFGGQPALFVFAVVFAAGYGGYAATQSPVIAEFFGLKHHGSIFGIAMFASGMGSAVGPYVTGLIYDTTGSYNLAYAGCAMLCTAGLVIAILLKPAGKMQ